MKKFGLWEMARDREVWRATVHAAAKIQRQLGPPTLL